MADFTALNDKSAAVLVEKGETISWTTSGTFVGTVALEFSEHPDVGFNVVDSTTTTETKTRLNSETKGWYRLRCSAYTSGTITVTAITEVAGEVAYHWEDTDSNRRFEITDAGAKVTGTFETTGAATLASASVTGTAALAATTHSGNATFGVNDTGVDVTFYGDTASKYAQWDASANALKMQGDLFVYSTGTTEKFSVAHATGNTAIAGTGTITGDFSVGANKFNVAAATGNTQIDGTLDVDGVATIDGAIITGYGNGVIPAGAGIAGVEYGAGGIHKTVITLTAAEIGMTDNHPNGQWGGQKLYSFPAGNNAIIGMTVDVDITLVGANWAAASTGKVAVGSVVISDASAMDSTNADFVASTNIAAMTDKVGPINCKSAAVVISNAAGAADAEMFLNITIDEDAAATTATATLTGTVTILWANYGDY